MPNFAPSHDPARLSRCYDDGTLRWLKSLAARHDPAGILA
jgi:hypothetical protein